MNDMIIFMKPNSDDKAQLKNLWEKVFEEKQGAVDLVFDEYFDIFNPYCAKDGAKIVAALYLLNGRLNGERAHYLCGAATLPDYRNQGIMSGLIEYALKSAKKDGDRFSLLLPANDGLYSYYSRLGYIANCSAKAVTLTRAQLEKSELNHTASKSICSFKSLQKRCFYKDYFEINERFFDFAAKYYGVYGARLLKSENAVALVDASGECADVIYFVCADFGDLKSLLLKSTTAEEFILTAKANNALLCDTRLKKDEKTEKCGMIKALDEGAEIPNDIFIGITLQ